MIKYDQIYCFNIFFVFYWYWYSYIIDNTVSNIVNCVITIILKLFFDSVSKERHVVKILHRQKSAY